MISQKNILLLLTFVILVSQGCSRSTSDFWDDTKTCSRHVQRGFKSLGGKNGVSRAVSNKNDFYCVEEYSYPEEEFIPLQDNIGNQPFGVSEMAIPQSRNSPGEQGSPVPGIESFRDPSTDPRLASVFRNVHFDYNQYLIKGEENISIVHDIANYINAHPGTYIFVEGHCDERGPEAYNLALGARRANAVRNMLVNEGVNPDVVFTISYGKERPLFLESHEEAWSKNRRSEFKVY